MSLLNINPIMNANGHKIIYNYPATWSTIKNNTNITVIKKKDKDKVKSSTKKNFITRRLFGKKKYQIAKQTSLENRDSVESL